MSKFEQAPWQVNSASSCSSRVYDDPYEEPPNSNEFSSSSGLSDLLRLSSTASSLGSTFDSRGPGDGASARREMPLVMSPQGSQANDNRNSAIFIPAENTERRVVNNPSASHYDEPWDLSSKRQELEDQFRAMPCFAYKPSERSTDAANVRPKAHLAADDKRQLTDGYDKPWDLQPHRRDGRDDDGYDKPWDLKPHEKDVRASVAAAGEYDSPWDIKPRSMVEKELIAAKSAKDAAAVSRITAQPQLRPSQSAETDARPAVEYDEPWDQKKKQLLFKPTSNDGPVYENCPGSASPAPVPQRRQPPAAAGVAPQPAAAAAVASSASASVAASSSVQSKSNVSVGEQIDPKLPLEQQSWYHGSISRTDAESLLRSCREGSYLVRTSESNRKDYSLSVNKNRSTRKSLMPN